MARQVWEFLDTHGRGVLKAWLVDQSATEKERAKLDYALHQLRTLEFALVARSLLAGPLRNSGGIFKLRLRCQDRELRPLLCRGTDGDYVMLCGATEVGDSLHPSDAIKRAEENRRLLLKYPHRRALI